MKVNQISTSRTPDAFSLKPSIRLVTATPSSSRSQHLDQDTVDVSSSNQTVASLAQAATAQSPARAAKVQALKQAVENGQYQLDSAKIAASLANAVV